MKFLFWRRHARFLRTVLVYTFSALGGPQVHFALMQRYFVEREKILSTQALIDLNLFCQILPGPASTQTLGLIAYRQGGVALSLVALSIWILPSMILMFCFAYFFSLIDSGGNTRLIQTFQFLSPMALGFFFYYFLRLSKALERRKTSVFVVVLTAVLTFMFFHSPWIFPAVIVLGGIVSYIVNRKKNVNQATNTKKIAWKYLILFCAIFLIAGVVSESARTGAWKYRKECNLFENNYRFGTLIFGGGQVLVSMIYEKYAVSPKTKYLEKKDILVGAGMLQVVPGPVFSISTFVGARIFAQDGAGRQFVGALIATVAIFLPGYFLCIFFHPIWLRLRYNSAIFRAMMGLHAAIVGLLFGSFVYLVLDNHYHTLAHYKSLIHILVFFASLILLLRARFPTPLLVLGVLILGYVVG